MVQVAAMYSLLENLWSATIWFFSKQTPDDAKIIRHFEYLRAKRDGILPAGFDEMPGLPLTRDDLLPRPSPAMRCWTRIWGLAKAGASVVFKAG